MAGRGSENGPAAAIGTEGWGCEGECVRGEEAGTEGLRGGGCGAEGLQGGRCGWEGGVTASWRVRGWDLWSVGGGDGDCWEAAGMGRRAGAAASGCGRGEERRSVGWLVDVAGRVIAGRRAGLYFF